MSPNYDRYLDSQALKEEREMEAAEVREAEMDAKMDDYLKSYAAQTEKVFIRNWNAVYPNPVGEWGDVPLIHQDIDDFGANINKEPITELIKAGMLNRAGAEVGYQFTNYLREIALQAVREDMKL